VLVEKLIGAGIVEPASREAYQSLKTREFCIGTSEVSKCKEMHQNKQMQY